MVAAADNQPREFLGVAFDLMAEGERLMVTKMKFRVGTDAAAHAHPHEQAGYVVSGRFRQTSAGMAYELGPGDSYAIPGGVEHTMEVFIDVTPPRENFR